MPSEPAPTVRDGGASAASATSVNTTTATATASVSTSASAPSTASAGAPDAGVPAIVPMKKEDWEVAIGHWTFNDDGTVDCACKEVSSLMFWKHDRPKDLDVSVDVMFLGPESSAGIVFREQGADWFSDATLYQFEWYTTGSHHGKRLSLMRKAKIGAPPEERGPFWMQIVTPKYEAAPYDRWITFRVRAIGDRYETWIDGEPAFTQTDDTFVRTGRIALHVFQPTHVRFRNFVLKAP